MDAFWRRTAASLRGLARTNSSASINHPLSTSFRPPSFFTARQTTQRVIAASAPKLNKPRRQPAVAAVSLLFALAVASYSTFPQNTYAEAPPKDNIRLIRLAEVQKHGRDASSCWVIRGTRVYDISDFIPNHPGGEVILKGVGGVIDPLWKIFSIHHKQEVYDILEDYFIGVVDPRDLVDGAVPQEAVENPFKNDPARDQRLRYHTTQPCNAETPAEELGGYLTPNDIFYVRNHFWVPETPEEHHRLTIELPDGEEKTYTMEELKTKFKPYKITAALQCSGNRRSHMTEESYRTSGLQWKIGAIGNANWVGVRLRDLLQDAGFDIDNPPDEIRHACFAGAEAYSASIPLEKALDRRGDVLLAYEMNGQPLPRDHGYPLRVLVPGTVAARSVKWVTKISLTEEESYSQWQRRDYKAPGPSEGPTPDWDKAASIQETPVQSVITSIRDVNCLGPMSKEDHKMLEVFGLEEDCVKVEGYAISGGGRKIVRVDVSADNGHTWNKAELLEGPAEGSKMWGWQRWRFGISQRRCGRWFLVKAVDESYNSQSNDYDAQYNCRGHLTTAWHRVPYKTPL